MQNINILFLWFYETLAEEPDFAREFFRSNFEIKNLFKKIDLKKSLLFYYYLTCSFDLFIVRLMF